jgi:glycosyltransferase involved in cell wall biosynthesis
MKILYVITKANWGGAQKYVHDLAVAARGAGHEVVVAYGLPPARAGGAQAGEAGALVGKLDALHIRTLPLPTLERDVDLAREWRTFWLLRDMLRQEAPDVVHVNSSKAAGLGVLAARLAGVRRIVFTAHGWAFNEARPWWQRVLIYKLAWLTILLSHKTICVSEAIRRDTRWMPFVRGRLVVVYNGVHEPVYKAREEARRALWPHHEGGTWIGMLSELHPTKRVEDALEAFTLLRRERPETRLIVLGEGEERARLEWLVSARGLEGSVRLAGLVSDGDTYLRAFDLFLHTSKSEALGLAVIEAGLAGLPVVATSVGGIPEVIEDGETGILVPPYSPRDVARALLSCMADPARGEAMGEALRTFVRTRFDARRMLGETLALYRSD